MASGESKPNSNGLAAPTILIIDSFALIHRAYHAYPKDLMTKDGVLVNAMFGFAKLMIEVVEKFKPEYVVAVFDSAGPTFRAEMYEAYKAHRKETDSELITQIPLVAELLNNFDIPVLSVSGFEADDIIGTITKQLADQPFRQIVVTGDRDLFQLVGGNTYVYLSGSSFSQSQLFDSDKVKEKMEVGPEHITDIKGLQGDPSDNIPGVPGVGAKTAVKLITEYGTVEDIYSNIDKLVPALQAKLAPHREIALLSKNLATIQREMAIEFDVEDCHYPTFNPELLREFLAKYQFYSLLKHIPTGTSAITANISSENSNRNLNVTPYSGQGFESEQVFVTIQLEGSTIQDYKLTAITIQDGDTTYEAVDNFEEIFSKLTGITVVSIESKKLRHAVLNMGLNPSYMDYDLCMAGVICGAGGVKNDWLAIKAFYLMDNLADLAAIADLYKKIKTEFNADFGKVLALEMKLIRMVSEMERFGISVNKELLQGFGVSLRDMITTLQADVYKSVGHEFNISSPKQVGDVLFAELGLANGKKTKTGGFSTDERTLKEIMGAHPVVAQILEYRELTKLLSTYVESLPAYISPQTGRIHSNMDQMGAITGRFASRDPNLQNLPVEATHGIDLRAAIVPAEGFLLVSFDYSQQELRLLAEFSGEERMRDAFINHDDVHSLTASQILGVPLPEITKEQRRVGKTINFGIVYGMSGFGLSDRLKIEPKKASEFITMYFERYSKVKAYFDTLVQKAKTRGYVETFLGRRRNAGGLNAPNFQVRSAAEREVINFPLQGGAADIIKMAMVQMPDLSSFNARLVLQVHDELIFEYPGADISEVIASSELQDFVRKVRVAMLGNLNMSVPFEVGVEIGHNLSEMQEFEVD